VPPRLAQEELERVRRRLVRELLRGRRRWRGLALLLLEDLDSALVELSIEGVDLELVERVDLEELREIGTAERARRLRTLDQGAELLVLEHALDEVDHAAPIHSRPFRNVKPGRLSTLPQR
jgi:hypothetical protein